MPKSLAECEICGRELASVKSYTDAFGNEFDACASCRRTLTTEDKAADE